MSVMINANTRLNKTLDLDQKVVDYIVSLNPHDFERLHVPLMRRYVAPRITLGRVAEMVHVPVAELLCRIAELGHAQVDVSQPDELLKHTPQTRPEWATGANLDAAHEVDLLALDEALNADPLPPVMRIVHALAPGQVMRFKHKWEPQPFYDLWTRMGELEWFSEQLGANEWWIWVRHMP